MFVTSSHTHNENNPFVSAIIITIIINSSLNLTDKLLRLNNNNNNSNKKTHKLPSINFNIFYSRCKNI